ncbi:MAG: PAS domain S-box protein [Magnetococcales bacterium]|nr:PAS domain S-box protein [Magnetococcales bacterium]
MRTRKWLLGFPQLGIFWLVVIPILIAIDKITIFETFIHWARQHNVWYLGKLVSVLILSLLPFLVYLSYWLYRMNKTLRENVATIARLNQSNDWLASAVRQSADMILITDDHGITRYVNPAFEALSGYREEEVIGKDAGFLRNNQHPPAFHDRMVQRLQSGESWQNRFVTRRKDGSTMHLDLTISPIRDRQGRITLFVGAGRDVTREEELGWQLRKSQRMESIGVLAGGIAHDFNNIMTAIHSYAELVLDDVETNSQAHHNLNEILVAVVRAKEVVKGLLTFSRRDEGERLPILLGPVIREAMKLLEIMAPDSVRVTVRVNGDEWPVLADSTRIYQVIMNLANNAAQAMWEKGGVLEVELSRVQVDEAWIAGSAPLEGMESGWYMRLMVKDTGVGIEPEVLERIFEPFFTTRGLGKGSGLGLSVVHGIVQGHDGRIVVESEVGKGSSFWVYFPAVRPSIGSGDHATDFDHRR